MAIQKNMHRRDVQLNIGDLVYVSIEHFLLAHQLSHKLAPRCVGPFLIGAIINSIAFHAELPAEYGCVHPIFHISYLQPYVGPAPPSPLDPLPLDDIAAGEYKVEDILDSRLGRLGTKYLIKWIVYPIFESIWEPSAHLSNAPDILHQFLSHQR